MYKINIQFGEEDLNQILIDIIIKELELNYEL